MSSINIPEKMAEIVRAMNGRFSLNGRPLTAEDVFSPTGLLPGISRRADQLCSLCLGYGIGITFEEAEGSVLGVKVIYDDVTPSNLRLLCLVDVVYELMKGTPRGEVTSLDQLLYD